MTEERAEHCAASTLGTRTERNVGSSTRSTIPSRRTIAACTTPWIAPNSSSPGPRLAHPHGVGHIRLSIDRGAALSPRLMRARRRFPGSRATSDEHQSGPARSRRGSAPAPARSRRRRRQSGTCPASENAECAGAPAGSAADASGKRSSAREREFVPSACAGSARIASGGGPLRVRESRSPRRADVQTARPSAAGTLSPGFREAQDSGGIEVGRPPAANIMQVIDDHPQRGHTLKEIGRAESVDQAEERPMRRAPPRRRRVLALCMGRSGVESCPGSRPIESVPASRRHAVSAPRSAPSTSHPSSPSRRVCDPSITRHTRSPR